ncbi:MAG TPA: hypothetical protein VF486_24160 [Actinomycetes bacterium]
MKLYAEQAPLRLRQVALDLLVAAWVAGWGWLGVAVYRLVDKLAGPGRAVEQAGNDFASNMGTVRDKVGRVPLVGEELRAPFGRLGGVGQTLAGAAHGQQQVVHQLAWWLGVLLAAVPIVMVLLLWLPPRLRWAREAAAAARLRDDNADLHLFALRAVARRPLRQLRLVTDDPAGALAAGRYDALAALELQALGLRATPR